MSRAEGGKTRATRLGRVLRPVGAGALVIAWIVSLAWSVQMVAAGIVGPGAVMCLALLRIAAHACAQRSGRAIRLWMPLAFVVDLVTLVGAVLLIAWAALVASGGGFVVIWAALAAAGVAGVVRIVGAIRAAGISARPVL